MFFLLCQIICVLTLTLASAQHTYVELTQRLLPLLLCVCCVLLQMSQVNPALFHAMNLKTEPEPGQGSDTSEAAQYLNRVLKRPLLEKHTEIWRTYLRRYKNMQDVHSHKTGFSLFILIVRKQRAFSVCTIPLAVHHWKPPETQRYAGI